MLDFKRDATNPPATLGHGRTIRRPSNFALSNRGTYASLANGLLLDRIAASPLGAPC
jgi:hypothetical protein